MVAWVAVLLRTPDRTDALLVAALVLFTAACALSMFPRSSFDAATSALAWASALGVARRILTDPAMRRYAISVMAITAAVLAIVVVTAWGAYWLAWLRLTDWSAVPPLDLDLPSGVWAHRHDLTTLLVFVAPAPWIAARGRRWMLVLAAFVCAFIGAAVMMDGSRTIWLAVGVTAVWFGMPYLRHIFRSRQSVAFTIIAVATLLGVAFVLGAADEVFRRLGNVHTLAARTAQWGSALTIAAQHPLQGGGPGGYPFILHLTDYFDTNAYVSRHPDNAYVQLVVEGGGLAITAVTFVGAALLAGWRSNTTEARVAAGIFVFTAIDAIGMNPVAYGFLLAPLTVWAALTTSPHIATSPNQWRKSRGLARYAIVAALVLIGTAQATVVVAVFAYGDARDEAADGDWPAAIGALELASNLDPSMALYLRELGTARVLSGDLNRGIRELEHATMLNPADDTALRVLSIAHARRGEVGEALVYARAALERDRSDPLNLLFFARAADDANQPGAAREALSRAISRAPWMPADPHWAGVAPTSVEPEALAGLAVDAWNSGAYPWVDTIDQALLLAQLRNTDARSTPLDPDADLASVGSALRRVFSCETASQGLQELRDEQDELQAYPRYWLARLFAEVALGNPLDPNLAELGYLRSPQLKAIVNNLVPGSDPFSGRFKDQFGYRRASITHDGVSPAPSDSGGLAAWFDDPARAAALMAMETPATVCRL